jgi:ATP-binding cassette subfamily F protein 3
MLELTADRLVLVDNGTATEYDGSLDDYTRMILSKGANDKAAKRDGKKDKKAAAEAREKAQALRKRATLAEQELARLTEQRGAIDRAMFDPKAADASLATLSMSDLMKRRADLADRIEAAEAAWLEASEALEQAA